MKLCRKCNTLKELSEFSKNKAKKDGLQSTCKDCCRKAQKLHYRKNKAYYKAKSGTQRNATKEWLLKYKEGLVCSNCGDTRHYVLDFHHLDPSKKFKSITKLANDGYTIGRLKDELKKCIVLCSNCHRELHYKERHRLE